MSQPIPFMDLSSLFRKIEPTLMPKLHHMMANSQFIGGTPVDDFEESFAVYCKASYCAGVSSGTSALYLALRALGLKKDDEVIIPANTFAATAAAVCIAGGIPVLVDVSPDRWTLDPNLIEEAITPKTKAIIPVHLYGQPADMDPIMEIASRNNLIVLEDAAQAHGAEYNGERVGNFGHAAGFSFYPGKNLGAFGDAGAIVSNDVNVIDTVKMIRNHGQAQKYVHEVIGDTARLDAIQAAVLLAKLPHLQSQNKDRQKVADLYKERLFTLKSEIQLPEVAQGVKHVWHLYVIHLKDRERLVEKFLANGISTGMHYPVPLNEQPAFQSRVRVSGSLKYSKWSSEHLLSLPMFPSMTEEQVARVAQVIFDHYS